MKQEQSDSFDVIIFDAFNSGSIPIHLISVEDLREYHRKLRRDGLLLMHVSSRYLHLRMPPVVAANAAAVVLGCLFSNNAGNVYSEAKLSERVALFSISNEPVKKFSAEFGRLAINSSDIRHWIDKYANILSAICGFYE